jgi:Dolichyl-phosphate-mannose-protein mannosyltransferase
MKPTAADDPMNAQLAWLILALMIAVAVTLRLPAEHWLIGAADTADFSFQPDDERFVLAAKDIKAPNPDGYPQGMTTQLFLAHLAVSRFSETNILQVLHGITIFYAGLSILLTYVIARSWRMSRSRALLGAALLSVAPLVMVQSNFGTADITAMFYFYATLFTGGQYLRTRKQLWFVILCLLTGMAVAVKFFIPLFAPLALVLAIQRKGERLAQVLTAVLIVIASFEALSFFKFTPWDLHHLVQMLRYDNVVIAGVKSDIVASGPFDQLLRYSWDLVSAVGIATAVLFVIGLFRWSRTLSESAQRVSAALFSGDWRTLVAPPSLFIAALSLQALLIVISRIHAERHVLVFVPLICIAAAEALFGLFAAGKFASSARFLAIAVILAYQTSDAVAIEGLYRADIRNDLARWTAQQAANGARVYAMAPFSHVRGSTFSPDQNPLLLDQASYIVTCDFEYARYLHHQKAIEIFHPMGGQDRLDFFRGVFEGDSEFGIVREFKSTPRGVELRLINAHVLAPLGTFVPRRCYALGRVNKLPPDAQRAIRADVVSADRGW